MASHRHLFGVRPGDSPGRAFSRGYGRRDARRAERLDDLIREAPEGKAHALALDLTDTKGIQRVVEQVLDRFGRIDVLVNNAGHGQVGAVEETTDEELRSIFEVHVFGPASHAPCFPPCGSGAPGRSCR